MASKTEIDKYWQTVKEFQKVLEILVNEKNDFAVDYLGQIMQGSFIHADYCLQRGVSWNRGLAERGITPPSEVTDAEAARRLIEMFS